MATITVEIPKVLYEQLRRAAALARQPIEKVVAESLSHSLPPLLNDIPPEYQADVYPLLQMGVEDLRQEVNRVFSTGRWAKFLCLIRSHLCSETNDSQITTQNSKRCPV